MFRRVAGRPVLPCMDRAAQRRRTISRCQRRIVPGVTSSGIRLRWVFGIAPSRAASSARSAQFRSGRRGCRRCRTASWWRRIKISAVFHASSRWDSRSHSASLVIRRNTNRRHMIGDHHREAPGEQLCWSELWMRFSARTGAPVSTYLFIEAPGVMVPSPHPAVTRVGLTSSSERAGLRHESASQIRSRPAGLDAWRRAPRRGE